MSKITGTIDILTTPAIAEVMAAGQQGEVVETDQQETYFDFKWAKERFDKIISEWQEIKKVTERNRLLRYLKCDKSTLESLGLFKADETYIAVRLIDQNIRAEQPQRLAYITQPRRSVVLKPLYGVNVNGLENVETIFTDCARYSGWETPFMKSDDGASTHGWDFVEIVFDPSKPGHFGIEHVGHENLMFDLETEDINNQEVLGRVIPVTASQLRKNVKEFDFSEAVYKELVEGEAKNESKTKDIVYHVYKFFFRFEDAIYVCWYGGEKTTDYLCKPVPLYLGINAIDKPPVSADPEGKPVYSRTAETTYPFFQLDYLETEAPKVVEKKGRAYLDEPAQEGASAIMSGIVNGVMRASNVYAAPAPSPVPNTDTAPPKQTDIKLKSGVIYDKPLVFFHTDYPPEAAMQALEITTQYNRLDISRPDYAVKNRKDSRKTATEISASVQDASMQASVQSTQQSVFMRRVYTKCYEIFQNRALQGDIPITDPVILALLKVPVDIKAAGDVDVIQRQEKLQRQMQAWPIVSMTPLAMPFLQDYLVNAFPEEAPKYLQYLQQDQQAKQLVGGLAEALRVAVTDESGQLKPEFLGDAAELQQLAVGVQGFLTQGQGEQQNGQQSTDSQPAVAA